ncbi:hypothetical protein BJF92_17910 [Rhizobium rhizosphaerae]|uniref:EamA domain-containing protein n=1 Tax=Xaviernesmea rhizosphaerae TaxID=1672749 RepID=A0A1Q9ADC8_9HYPH|nr:DMT family transporter [Xaviernesmea rhizosphaerae]OLP52924.1 hypothetical protein BJF92_17910 [Xaviernesmea rhizosphaerae]
MLAGLLFGLSTCALWGLTFVAPRAVAPFTPLDLAVARYGVFGLASLAFLLRGKTRRALLDIAPSRRLLGLLLGGAGYIGYFLAVARAVNAAGAVLPPLITGLMPVILPWLAHRRSQTLSRRSLLAPLGLILIGLILVQLGTAAQTGTQMQPMTGAGLAFSVLALAIWIAYAQLNAMVLQAGDPPEPLAWTCLQGLGAAIGALVLLPWTSLSGGHHFSDAEVGSLVLWSLLMGLAGSFLTTVFWSEAARRLPLALAAQLIVAETVFGMAYGLIYEMRRPTWAETAGAACQIFGVCLAIARFAEAAQALQPKGNTKCR